MTLALLAALPLLAQGVATRNAPAAPRRSLSGRPWPVTFTDVAAQSGLTAPLVSGSESSKAYILEANGAGAAFLDYDNDGALDVFLVTASRFEPFAEGQAPTNRLYRNDGRGRFTDVTRQAGLGRSGWGQGVCAGDFDSDGHLDLYVTYWGPNVLYRNTGDGKFTDVTLRAGVAGPAAEWSTGCTFLDYDRDGRLDLFVTSYAAFDRAKVPSPGQGANCQWKGLAVFCGPRGLPYGTVTLYHNRGDGTFEDVTRRAGLGSLPGCYAFTALAADLNQDGFTDLYVACDSTPSLFLRNNKNGTFSEIGAETGLAFNEHGFEQGGMGVAAADFDLDGRVDIIKTNFAGDYPNLYRNTGGGIFEDVVVRAGLAVNPQYVAWGVAFADLDNDGLPDVFQTNGHVYPEIDRLKGAEAYRNPRLVYRNLGNGTFEDVSALAGPGIAARHSSRGAALGDFDNDGDLDVLVLNMGEPPSLLRNDLKAGNHWLQVRLAGVAIGAQVAVERQTLPVLSQSSFLSQNDLRLHFGLGSSSEVSRITVRWPSGRIEHFPGSPADRIVMLKEGAGQP
jgi:hypothetical protein